MIKDFKFFNIAVILLVLLFLYPVSGFAQDISIEVELSSKKVPLGSTTQLKVTINGTQAVDSIQLPAIEGFDVNYVRPLSREININGQRFISKTFIYSLFAVKEGTFEIPAFDVEVSGKTYRVDPVSIEVISSPVQSAPGTNKQATLADKIFLVLKVPKSEIYLNERLPVKVYLYVSEFKVEFNPDEGPQIGGLGFSIEGFGKPKQYQQVVEGIPYGVVEFDAAVYPTRTGELTLGPARMDCDILIGDPRRASPFGRGMSPFDDDFFNSFFGRSQKQPITLESETASVNVLPLPEENKPEDFSGAVGKFDFNVSVSPTDVKEGDPITLRMTVLGQGNLSAIQMPSLSSQDDFKIYAPQIFEKEGIKKTEQVIIPRSAQITEVPSILFSYFDPETKTYKTITRGPFPIAVKKLEKEEKFKVVGLEGEVRTPEPETLGKDIVFIKTRPGRLRIIGEAIHKSSMFYIFFLIFAVLWMAGFIYYRRTYRIKTDIVYARRLQAPRQAKQGLAQAKKLITARKGEEFYDTVFKTIQQYLGNKFHLSSGSVTFETVQSHLSQNNIEQKVIDDIKLTYEECDMIRYASAGVSGENMNASYQRLAQIIDHLERFVK